jgi:hypothetical protein
LSQQTKQPVEKLLVELTGEYMSLTVQQFLLEKKISKKREKGVLKSFSLQKGEA